MINGPQMRVMWHVDDLKVSHESELEITNFIVYLGNFFRNKIAVNQGDVHDYLGTNLYYSEMSKRMANVFMVKYMDKFLKDFPEEIK